MNIAFLYPHIHGKDGYPRDVARLCAEVGQCGGVNVTPLPQVPVRGLRVRTATAALCLMPELYRRRADFDLVHFFGMFFTGYSVLGSLLLRSGTPYVVSPLGALLPAALERSRVKKRVFLRAEGLRFLSNAVCLHAFTDEEADSFRVLGLSTPVVNHPLGLYPEDLPSELDTLPRVVRGDYLLFFGRLDVKQKGIDYLLDEFASYLNSGGQLKLVIAGRSWNGSHEFIRKQIAHLGLQTNVFFLGEVSLEDKFALMRHCTAFIYPTRHDGPPRPIRDALAMHKRILMSHEANVHDSVEDCGWGYRFHVRRGELCQAMCRLEGETSAPPYIDPVSELSWKKLAHDLVRSYVSILHRSDSITH